MSANLVCDVEQLAAAVPHGAKLAVAKDPSGVAMAATRALVRHGVRDLHLVCVPIGGIQADILIGARAVATLETSAVTLGEYGPAPRFSAAVRGGTIKLLDATCPAIYAALQAAEKGNPFIPLRGLIGSDLLTQRPDWKVIDNPFAPGDKIVALPAIRPDLALFHAPLADRYGNVFIARNRELMTMAHAAQATLVTVERIVERNLLDDETMAGAVIPALYIQHLAQAERGAWPLALPGHYPEDEAFLADYARQAREDEGFARILRAWLEVDRAAA